VLAEVTALQLNVFPDTVCIVNTTWYSDCHKTVRIPGKTLGHLFCLCYF